MARARSPGVVQPLLKTPAPTDARWQFSQGPEFIEWTEAQLKIPRGGRRGEKLTWSPWQKEWWMECLRCDEDRNWFYRLAVLGVPKKNTKSVMSAALAIWHVFGDSDEPDPWVPIGASSDEQADIIFGDAKTMAELNEDIKAASQRFTKLINIKDLQTGHPHIERVAASKGHLDGKDSSLVPFDEVHECEQESWRILTNSIVGRKRAMVLSTTTAGFDKETVLGRLFDRAEKQAKGETPGDRTLMWWYAAPQGADHRDPKVWAAANPNYGITVTAETLGHELTKNTEAEFRRYFLNQWTKTENLWVGHALLDACELEEFELQPKAPTWVTWDAATKYDSTMVMTGQWFDWGPSERNPEGKPVLGVRVEHWERPVDMNGDLVPEWTLPIAEVRKHVEGLGRRFDLQAIGFDPQFVTWEAQEMENAGQPMVEIPQTDSRMIPGTQALYQLIQQERFAWCQPVVRRHIEQSGVATTRRGERLVKGRDRKANEGAICAVMLAGLVMGQEEESGFVLYVPPARNEGTGNGEQGAEEESEGD